MKCIHCGQDSKYTERTKRLCPKCRRKFVFEPREGDPVTDSLFDNAIGKVSGEGKIRWGVEHLYYEVCRRKKHKMAPLPLVWMMFIFAAFLLGVVVLTGDFLPVGIFVIVITLGGLVALVTRSVGPYVRFDLQTFNALYARWKAVHGTPPGVIVRAPTEELPKHIETDLGDYSFDRAVICDRARTVDLLVANNFHFENNCAILTMDGYPKGPFAIIRSMLKKNPKLQVFVLHDATVAGCQLAHRLVTDPSWFGGTGLRVIDLGLRPRHARPFEGLYDRGEGARVTPEEGISVEEAQWLEKNFLALAAARPEQVVKRLFAGLQAHAHDDPRQRDTSPQGYDNGYVTYCGAFGTGGTDAGGSDSSSDGGSDLGSDGAADAFG